MMLSRHLISPDSIIPPMFHTHIQTRDSLTRMTKGRTLENTKGNALSGNWGALHFKI
jgi:hypothetical protein